MIASIYFVYCSQQQLYNVLRVYSRYDPEVNYCQSMGFIAAILLTYITEEETFWILVALFKGKFDMRRLYLPGLPLTIQYLYVYEHLVEQFYPKIFQFLVCTIVFIIHNSDK